MKKLILAMVVFCATAAIADKDRGGGDVVFCRGVTINDFYLGGYYTLDYVAQAQVTAHTDLAFATSEEATIGIQKKLNEIFPALGKHFAEFQKLYKSKAMAFRVWRGGTQPLINIKDESLTRDLPVGCQELYQAVIRTSIPVTTTDNRPIRIYYDYNASTIDKIEKQPHQASFMNVHEWLRDFTDDAFEIRAINWYLHSKDFINGTEDEIVEAFKGFRIDGHGIWLRRGSEVRREQERYDEIMGNLQKKQEALCVLPNNDTAKFVSGIGDVIAAFDVVIGSIFFNDPGAYQGLKEYREQLNLIQKAAMRSIPEAKKMAGCQ